MRKADVDFVLDVLQNIESDEIDLDWYGILGYLELNKISGYFFKQAKAMKLELPQQIKRKLNNIFVIQCERNEKMKKWIDDISFQLQYDNIKHAFLKGSILSHCKIGNDFLYGIGERVSNDIDILISPKDISNIDKTLKNLGFKQAYWNFDKNEMIEFSRSEILSRRMNRGETAPYMQKFDSVCLNFVEVDINFSVDYLPTGNGELLDQMLEKAVVASRKNIKLYALDNEYNFLHLLMHQYKEAIIYSMVKRNKDLELYKYLDIYLYIKNELFDFNKFVSIIKNFHLEKECYFVLYTVSKIFKSLEISKLLKSFKPKNLDYLEEVIDVENNNDKYRWNISLEDRLYDYNKFDYLKRVQL